MMALRQVQEDVTESAAGLQENEEMQHRVPRKCGEIRSILMAEWKAAAKPT
jgi:hypothetical protein